MTGLYITHNRVVLRLNDTYSLSIVQGNGLYGDESTGTVEVGLLHSTDGLIGNPRGWVDGPDLVYIINSLLNPKKTKEEAVDVGDDDV
jgi:hypothetical protein